MPAYSIQPLDPAVHRRKEFGCESKELTDFLRERARKEMAAHASACFVLVPDSDPGRIAGFYTLSASVVALQNLPSPLVKKLKLPRYNDLPAILLGRLARDSEFRGQGIGDRLMIDALRRAFSISQQAGSVAVITDPKDALATAFYAGFNFRPLTSERLFLPMQEIERLVAAPGT